MPRKSVARLTDRLDMTIDVYRGRKTTKQHNNCKVNQMWFLFICKEKTNAFIYIYIVKFWIVF